MKNIILFAIIGIMIASCSKTEETPEIICDTELSCVDENCQFTISNTVGHTKFLPCFDSWAIIVESDVEVNSWYIPDEWDSSYEVDSIEVTFCGYVRDNTLPLIFPDPMPGRFYQIELEAIEKNEE